MRPRAARTDRDNVAQLERRPALLLAGCRRCRFTRAATLQRGRRAAGPSHAYGLEARRQRPRLPRGRRRHCLRCRRRCRRSLVVVVVTRDTLRAAAWALLCEHAAGERARRPSKPGVRGGSARSARSVGVPRPREISAPRPRELSPNGQTARWTRILFNATMTFQCCIWSYSRVRPALNFFPDGRPPARASPPHPGARGAIKL